RRMGLRDWSLRDAGRALRGRIPRVFPAASSLRQSSVDGIDDRGQEPVALDALEAGLGALQPKGRPPLGHRPLTPALDVAAHPVRCRNGAGQPLSPMQWGDSSLAALIQT